MHRTSTPPGIRNALLGLAWRWGGAQGGRSVLTQARAQSPLWQGSGRIAAPLALPVADAVSFSPSAILASHPVLVRCPTHIACARPSSPAPLTRCCPLTRHPCVSRSDLPRALLHGCQDGPLGARGYPPGNAAGPLAAVGAGRHPAAGASDREPSPPLAVLSPRWSVPPFLCWHPPLRLLHPPRPIALAASPAHPPNASAPLPPLKPRLFFAGRRRGPSRGP